MKKPVKVRALTLDRPPPLNRLRSMTVAIAICIAFALAIYLAIG